LARLDSQKHCQKSTEKAERELRQKREKKVWFGIFAWIAIDTICPETFVPVIFQGTVHGHYYIPNRYPAMVFCNFWAQKL
jgi:hypothetical protein